MKRIAITFLLLLVAPVVETICACSLLAQSVSPAAQSASDTIAIRTEGAGPRQFEPATRQSLARAYARAWADLRNALNDNNASVLQSSFTGFAHDQLAQAIADQSKLGLHTRYIDESHNARVTFYSPEGLSIQMEDDVQLRIEIYEGTQLLASNQARLHYLAVLTPTETTWKLRVLQATPQAAETSSSRAAAARVSGIEFGGTD